MGMTPRDIVEELKRLLREDPRVAVVLAEILGPPPALRELPGTPQEPQSK